MHLVKILKHRKIELGVLLVLVFEFTFPHYAVAVEPGKSVLLPDLVIQAADPYAFAEANQSVALIAPIRQYTVVETYNNIPITAYSSTIDQTDSTPCITANGFDLCAHNQEDVIAANFLPFGTKVRMPGLYGDRIFTVQDRMNARYYYRGDVWMKTRADAIAFGIQYTTIEVVE